MKEHGTWAEPTAMASLLTLKERHMRESGPTTTGTARAYPIASISSVTKDRSKEMSKMAWALRVGQTKALSLVIIREESGMAMVSRSGLIINPTRASTRKVVSTALARTDGRTAVNSPEIGSERRSTALACRITRTDVITKASIS